jgi:hypothetical protein
MFDSDIGEAAEYVECFVAFLDILGMSKLVEPTKDAPERVEQIADTLRLIAQLRSTPVTWRRTNVESGEVTKRTNYGFSVACRRKNLVGLNVRGVSEVI